MSERMFAATLIASANIGGGPLLPGTLITVGQLALTHLDDAQAVDRLSILLIEDQDEGENSGDESSVPSIDEQLQQLRTELQAEFDKRIADLSADADRRVAAVEKAADDRVKAIEAETANRITAIEQDAAAKIAAASTATPKPATTAKPKK